MQKDNNYNLKHAINLRKYERAVASIFDKMVEEAAALGVATGWDESKGSFSFDRFPKARKKFTDLMWRVRKDLRETIEKGMAQEWELSELKNTDILRALVASINATRKDEDKINEETLKSLEPRRADGLAGFQGRKVRGLGLSDRVWNVTSMASGQIELAIEQNLEKGKPAQKLSQDVRQALKEPDMMYRRYHKKITQADGTKKDVRVRYRKRVDDEGNVHFVEEPLEAVGTGVYRSAYKNAMRLARTETNMAYQKADSNYYNRSKFVLGIRVILSNNHTTKIGEGNKTVPLIDICDELQGDYPTEFEFTGWHPQCRCTTIPIMPSKAEMMDYLKRKAKGEDVSDYPFSGKVDKLPANFIEWASNNEDRLIRMQRKGTLPYFIRENIAEGFRFGYGIDLKDGVKWSGKEFDYNEEHDVLSMSEKVVEKPKSRKEIIEEIAAKRHAARTEDKERELTEFWQKKKEEGDIRRRRERWDAAAKKRHEERTEEQINRILAERKVRTDNYDIWEKNIKDAEARAQKNSWLTDEEKVLWIEGKTQAHLDLHSLEADALVQRMDVIDLMRPEWNRAALHTSEFDIYKDTLDEARRMISGGFKQKAIDSLTLLNSIEKIEPRYVDMRTYQKARPGKGGNKTKIEIALDEAEELIKNGDIKGAEAKIAEAEKTRKINEASNAAKARRKKAEEEARKKAEENMLTLDKCTTIDDYKKYFGKDMPRTLEEYEDALAKYPCLSAELSKNKDTIEAWLKKMFEEHDWGLSIDASLLEKSVLDKGFMNTFQVGKSKGYNGSNKTTGEIEETHGRLDTSHLLFRPSDKSDIIHKHKYVGAQLKREEYEKYGHLLDHDKTRAYDQQTVWYGDVQVRFRKDKVVPTWTFGDTLNKYRALDQYVQPTLAVDPKIHSFDRLLDTIAKGDCKSPINLRRLGAEYIEMQYHGKLTADCVESLVFNDYPEKKLSKNALKEWRKKGVDIYYYDAKKGEVVLYKKGITEAEAKLELEGKKDVDGWLKNVDKLSNKDIDFTKLSASIKSGKYIDALDEAERLKDEIAAMEAREKAIEKLLPDAKELHKQYTMDELEGAHSWLSRKFSYYETLKDDESTLLRKLKTDIEYVENPSKLKPGATQQTTWKVTQDALKRKRHEVTYELHKSKINGDLDKLRSYNTKDKTFMAKMQEIEKRVSSQEWFDVEDMLKGALDDMEVLKKKEGVLPLGESLGVKFSKSEFTQAKRDAALWFKDPDIVKAFREADEHMSKYAEKMWNGLTQEEKEVLWLYTDGSKYISEDMGYKLGIRTSPYAFKMKSAISGEVRNGLHDANMLTSILDKAPAISESMWTQSAMDIDALQSILGIKSLPNDIGKLVGKEGINHFFMSTHTAANGAFVTGEAATGGIKDVVFSIYMPKGTKGAYMEPFASYGDSKRGRQGMKYNGKRTKEAPSHQVEFLLQRGAKFKVTKAYYKDGRIYVDVDIIEQTALSPLDETIPEFEKRPERNRKVVGPKDLPL